MRDRLRLGFVGAGPVVARYHLRAVRGVPEVLTAMVVEADANRAQEFAKHQGFPRWSTQIKDLFGNVDIAVVAVPNDFHTPASCQLLEQGIHVLCEKPMARTVAECQEMIAAAQRGNAHLCIGHNRRFRQNVQLLRQLLAKGLVGDIIRVEAEEGSTADWPRSSAYFDPARSGGGALMDVGIHSIDLIRWLVGDFLDVKYTGNGTPDQVESDAEIRFTLAQGAEGVLVSSRTRNLQQVVTFKGTNGFLRLGLWSDYLAIRNDRGKPFQMLPHIEAYVPRRPPNDASFVLQLQNLIDAIRGEAPLLVDGHQGLAAVEVVRRAYGDPSLSGATTTQDTFVRPQAQGVQEYNIEI
jgi:UDP-N-acetylglucosamine 3-dehydrogenase